MSVISFEHEIKINIMKAKTSASEVSFLNSHQALIEGCKKGDQKAQFQIYKLYYKAMYNSSLRIVNNPMEAKDIMQESFLSAFESIGTYSGTVSFGTWLRKIVQNRSLDFLRKKSKMIFEDIESLRVIEDTIEDGLNINAEAESKVRRVTDVIKSLPEKCREILSLYLIEGYVHDEIAIRLKYNYSKNVSINER
jgi:RNA polymerase sigma-70 factor (ECF subfamily)